VIPTITSHTDTRAVELGVKFRADQDGYITGIRFYKGISNTGTHLGHLWTINGNLLAEVMFVDESSEGWQTATFATPVPILANTTYVASYHTDTGYYSVDRPYFTNGYYSSPLYAYGSGEIGGNGVYRYGLSDFPNQTYNSSNYWVDVIYVESIQ